MIVRGVKASRRGAEWLGYLLENKQVDFTSSVVYWFVFGCG
jgi:hypothetical protein